MWMCSTEKLLPCGVVTPRKAAPPVRSRPCVVAHDEVAFGEKAQRLPGRVRHDPHHTLDSPPKDIEAVFGLAIRLVVRDIGPDEAIEVDRAGCPLVVELLDDCLVLVRRHWLAPHASWDLGLDFGPAYALATTSRTSVLSTVAPSTTRLRIRSATVRASSSDSNTIIDCPLL